jgi:aspartyl-tRNA(Asn)/glutamyl-tRNA(Gln) amidotransferase subunit C
MKLTSDQVKHVAKLANLPLTSEEEEKYSKQLSKILDYIDQLDKADTKDVKPTYNVSGLENVMAEDEVGDCVLPQEKAIQNGVNTKNGYFVTKGVFSEE